MYAAARQGGVLISLAVDAPLVDAINHLILMIYILRVPVGADWGPQVFKIHHYKSIGCGRI
jgi:hypothetical protein